MKRIGKIKKVSLLCLFFLLSINSFATSVANNDGSAFITKAEFDALKSTFQAQLDQYNQGIDSKIDDAIASYLAGISVVKELRITDYYSKYGIKGYDTTWPLVWCSAKAASDLNATEKKYYASNINFRPIANTVCLIGVQNKYADETQQKIFGGSCFTGPIGSATEPEYLDIYKLTKTGAVDSALRIRVIVSVYVQQETGVIVTVPAETDTWPGFPYAKKSSYAFGNFGLYTNLNSPGRIWSEGINTKGEFAMIGAYHQKWANTSTGRVGGVLFNYKSTDCENMETTVAPCIFPFGATSIKVNASVPNVDAFENTTKGDYNYPTQSYSLASVSNAISALGFSSQWGTTNGRDFEWSENITITHKYYPKDYHCTQTADASQLVFDSFKTINDKNDKICNGLVLCNIPKEGLLKVKMKPSNKGKIYLWQANASEDTWGGRKSGATINESLFPYNVNVTTAGAIWERSFEVDPADGPLWLVYAPNSGTSGGSLQGTLDDIEITLTTED